MERVDALEVLSASQCVSTHTLTNRWKCTLARHMIGDDCVSALLDFQVRKNTPNPSAYDKGDKQR